MAPPPIVGAFWQLTVQSLTLPRTAAARILHADVPLWVWPALGSAALLTQIIAVWVVARVATPGVDLPPILQMPMLAAAVQATSALALTWVLVTYGRLRGGTGQMAAGLALVGWWVTMLCALRLLAVVVAPILPAAPPLIGGVAFGWGIWGLSAFMAQLHGFRNVLKLAGVVFISGVAVLSAGTALLTLSGVQAL